MPSVGIGAAARFVESVAALLAGLTSPPPLTVAVLSSESGAVSATLTVSVIGGSLAPAASASLRVQVTVPTVHVHPIPLIAVAVRPAGRVSVTVTVPDVGPAPMFAAVILYCRRGTADTRCPCANREGAVRTDRTTRACRP